MKRFVIITLIGLWSVSTISAAILYVDDSTAGANNGSSWQDAYLYLQDALAEALSGDEIRVAQGVYRPDQSAYLDGLIEGDRDASFQLKNGVILRGGYAGCETPDPDQRDIKGYATILSGDLARNDPAGIDLEDMVYGADRRENSIHVVVGTGMDSTAVLEGFVVMGGNANDSGDDGWVSTECGGGLYNGSGSCTVRECVFMYNSALSGGAVYNRDGSCPVFVNCTFSWNAYAGMYNDAQSSPTLEGCVFEGNLSCGMANCDRSNPTLTDCRIRRNRSGSAHGCGISNMDGSCPVLNRCVFEENFTGQRAGALYCQDNSNAVATDCVFRKNRATWYGGAVFSEWSRPVFRRCVFEDNESNSGGAIGIGNWDWYDGAGSDVNIESCLFTLNHAGKQGGAISVEISHQNRLAIINCTFADNAAPTGRAILCDSFMHNYASEVTVSSCILWDGGDEVSVLDRSHVSVRYSDVQCGLTGDGNLDVNPMFVNPDAGDYHLQSGSPCVDKGDNSVVPEGALDLDENPRIRGKAVDMGAYEYQYPIGTIIYVDDDATGANNGTSWKDAFNYLQLGMLSASGGDEIRVAQGVYKPHEGMYWDVTDLRSLTFLLRSGVRVVGGYAGLGSLDPDSRDVGKFGTILSGDLAGNDLPGFVNHGENSYHVVLGELRQPYPLANTLLDGFTITGGNADGQNGYDSMGGGILIEIDCALTVGNCTIIGNRAEYSGGGMHSIGSGGCASAIVNCRFVGNVSGVKGGGICLDGESNPQITNCLFAGNLTATGGALYDTESYAKIINCTFTGNRALSECGGVRECGGILQLTSCILWGNSDSSGSGELAQFRGRLDYSPYTNYCCIQGWTGALGGIGNNGDDPCFASPGWWNQNGTPDDPNDDLWADGDHHLKSKAGRWDANEGRWTADEVTSPCIDAGDPMSPIGYEPFPNGGIINMGAYGGTAEASKSYFGKPPCKTMVAGDINGDCKVGLADFAIMAMHWLATNNP